MEIIKRAEVHFENKKLLDKKIETGYEIVQDDVYQHMYRIKFPDGKISEQMYNITNAKENIYRIYTKKQDLATSTEKPEAPSNLEGLQDSIRSPLVSFEDPSATMVAPAKNKRS